MHTHCKIVSCNETISNQKAIVRSSPPGKFIFKRWEVVFTTVRYLSQVPEGVCLLQAKLITTYAIAQV